MPQEDLAAHGRHRKFSESEVEQGLHMLALFNGNRRRASRELEKAGLKVNPTTLRQWARDEPERYARIEDEVIPETYRELARRNEAVGLTALELQAKLLEDIEADREAGNLEPKDKHTALRNVGVTGGIAQEKGALARGRPTSHVQHDDPFQLARSIINKYPGVLQVDADVEVIEPTKDHTSDPAESS
jgi:hypothetical protein